MTRRRDDPPNPGSAAPQAPNGAPPWVVGDALQDMGGPDGAVEYRGDDGRPADPTKTPVVAPPGGMTNKQVFDPGTMIAPTEGAVDRVVVDLYNPGAPVAGAPLPDSGPNPIQPPPAAEPPAVQALKPAHTMLAPGFAAAPAPIPVVPAQAPPQPSAEDVATDALFEWLSRRGVAPAYFSSYTRARDIIWGGDPGGPVDPQDIDAAVERRAPSASQAQLDNLRDLGTLLVQYYGKVEPTALAQAIPVPTAAPTTASPVGPSPVGPSPISTSPEPIELDSGPESGLDIELEATSVVAAKDLEPPESATPVSQEAAEYLTSLELDEPAAPPSKTQVPISRRSQTFVPDPDPAPRHPTMEVELEVEVGERNETPVPKLLQDSAADLALDLDNLGPVKSARPTGETPLVEVAEETPVEFPDQPGWEMPAGFASAWDPRTRDQRPSEILRPPRSPVAIIAAVVLLVIAVVAVALAISNA